MIFSLKFEEVAADAYEPRDIAENGRARGMSVLLLIAEKGRIVVVATGGRDNP